MSGTDQRLLLPLLLLASLAWGCGNADGVVLFTAQMQNNQTTYDKVTSLVLNVVSKTEAGAVRATSTFSKVAASRWTDDGKFTFTYSSDREEEIIAIVTPFVTVLAKNLPLKSGSSNVITMKPGELIEQTFTFDLESVLAK